MTKESREWRNGPKMR